MIEDVRWGVQLAGLAAVALGSALGCTADDEDFAPVTGSSTADDGDGGTGEDTGDGAGGPPPDLERFVPRLERVTQQAGLELPHFTMDPRECLLEDVWTPAPDDEPLVTSACAGQIFTGAAAVGDYDGDGFDDIFFSRLTQGGVLFRNQGDGTFSDRTGTVALDALVPSNGAAWVDVDGDTDLDLFVLAWNGSRHQLWINDGGVFTEEGIPRGVTLFEAGDVHLGASVAVGDYDLDGWPDLAVTEWSPDFLAPRSTRLLHNRGDSDPGRFEDETVAAGLDDMAQHPQGTFAFAPAFVDLDDDGWPDLAVASDFGSSTLHWNAGDGTFVRAADAGVGLDDFGMGSTFGDFDLDGHLDWYVTSIFDPLSTCTPDEDCGRNNGNRLYMNLGDQSFNERAAEYDVYDTSWGWGAVAADLNASGRRDLLATNGYLSPTIPFPMYESDRDVLWIDLGPDQSGAPPAFFEVADLAGLDADGQGRGVLVFDYDRDGDLDLLKARYGAGLGLWRNAGAPQQGHWLSVTVRRDGRLVYNARVSVEREGSPTLIGQTGVGAHFGAQTPPRLYFGLGDDASPVRVRVQIGDDPSVVVDDVDVDDRVTIDL